MSSTRTIKNFVPKKINLKNLVTWRLATELTCHFVQSRSQGFSPSRRRRTRWIEIKDVTWACILMPYALSPKKPKTIACLSTDGTEKYTVFCNVSPMTLEYVDYLWFVLRRLFQLSLLFFSLLYFPYGDDVNARCILHPASINEMPAPDVVFVFIKISCKIFYNRFRVIRVEINFNVVFTRSSQSIFKAIIWFDC